MRTPGGAGDAHAITERSCPAHLLLMPRPDALDAEAPEDTATDLPARASVRAGASAWPGFPVDGRATVVAAAPDMGAAAPAGVPPSVPSPAAGSAQWAHDLRCRVDCPRRGGGFGAKSVSARVLLVDDDPAVLSGLRRALALAGYAVATAADGEQALASAASTPPDLVVLDVMLPGVDGLTVCRQLRRASPVPILMLTARDTVPDRVAGLDHGADDYLVKPFALDELLARVRALLRRAHPDDPDLLSYSDLAVDERSHEACRAGEPLRLTPREFDLLVAFLRHPRQALSRELLAQLVWGYGFEGESNFIDVAVKELRAKLEAGGRPRLLQTVRGVGYILREP